MTTCGTRACGLRRRHMRTTSAQSSGRIISSCSMPDHCAIGVSTNPGQIAIARTPSRVELRVERARERDHRRFRRAVRREAGRRQRPGDRREVDDPAARLAQQRDRRLRDEEEAAQVDAELQVELLRGQILDEAADADPGGVDENVEAAEALSMLGDGARAIVRIADVRGDGERAELGRCRLDLLRACAMRASARSPRRAACARSRARCPTSRR